MGHIPRSTERISSSLRCVMFIVCILGENRQTHEFDEKDIISPTNSTLLVAPQMPETAAHSKTLF